MPKDVIILPTFDRPEMLWFCLDRLSLCPEARAAEIKVYVDSHAKKPCPRAEVESVLMRFSYLPIAAMWRNPHPYEGNSYNVMEAYKEAFYSDAEFVYLVEDDVMVDRDFFPWHREAQKVGNWFCSIAWQCLKGGRRVGEYVLADSYASVGVCWRRENLKAVVEHARHEYYSNLLRYMRLTFPGIGDGYTEQDGLIERLVGMRKQATVFPPAPKCHHVGWYGYHRHERSRPAGTLEQRYEYVKKVAYEPQVLGLLSGNLIDVEAVTA